MIFNSLYKYANNSVSCTISANIPSVGKYMIACGVVSGGLMYLLLIDFASSLISWIIFLRFCSIIFLSQLDSASEYSLYLADGNLESIGNTTLLLSGVILIA